MTDRELLELAAKAAGIDVRWYQGDCLRVAYKCNGFAGKWNPLTDDGDALRLAVKIGIRDYFVLEVQKPCVQATCFEPWEHCEYEDYKDQDPIAAIRRAIVRAAAEIVKERK